MVSIPALPSVRVISWLGNKVNVFRRSIRIVAGGGGVARMSELLAKTFVAKRSRFEFGQVAVPMKALDGASLQMRPATSDLQDAYEFYTLWIHLPDAESGVEDPRQIVELGCNIGAALTSLGVHFPAARVLGVEPDRANAALARANTSILAPRATIVEAAIWDSITDLVVDRSGEEGSNGFFVRAALPTDPPGQTVAAATDVDTLLAEHMPEGPIDHMVINIEGTEPRILRKGGAWIGRCRSIKMETHPARGFSAEEAIALLEGHGFRAWREPRYPKFVVAVR